MKQFHALLGPKANNSHKTNWPLFFTLHEETPVRVNAGKSFVVLLIKTFFQWQIILSNVWWIIMNVGFVNIYVLLGQQSGGRLWFIARRTISICKAAIQIVNMLKWNICKHFAHYICSTSGWQQPGGMREGLFSLIFADVSGCYLLAGRPTSAQCDSNDL